jgi:hypothetical protein
VTLRHPIRWLPPLALSLAILTGLLAAGSRPIQVRTFSLEAADQGPVAVLHRGERVCEGPLSSPATARSVGLWGAAAATPARLAVQAVAAGTGRILAGGTLAPNSQPGQRDVRLSAAIPSETPIQICLVEQSGAFSLGGSTYTDARPGMVSSPTRLAPNGAEFSVTLLTTHSLLGSLPTAFSRASLWRPSWVGSWTFWVLTAALLAVLVLAPALLARAAASDDDAIGEQWPSNPSVPTPSQQLTADRQAV